MQLQSLSDHEDTLRQITQFEAQSLRLTQEIEQHRLYAPSHGTLLSIEAPLGQALAAGSALARFESNDGLAVEAFIAPDLRLAIEVGAQAQVQVQAAGQDTPPYPSQFIAISPEAQSTETGQYFIATLDLPSQIIARAARLSRSNCLQARHLRWQGSCRLHSEPITTPAKGALLP